MIPAPRKINLTDKETDRAVDGILRCLQDVTRREIVDGALLKGVALTSTPKAFNHKLGRAMVGYVVVRRSANAVVWDTAADASTVTLASSAAVTVTLWVF